MSKISREDFEESLLREDVVEYYMSKSPEELEEEFGPEVSRMVGFEQKNCHHCYDLWGHTLHTVESVSGEGLSKDQYRILKVAAFFHDIGKAAKEPQFNPKTGQQVFYGHAHSSAKIARPILEGMGYTPQEIDQICFLIKHHDDFISYKSTLPQYLINHEFIREINPDTVAEKIIENKYDFEKMGYSKDEVRTIVYTLAHGKRPDFRTKAGPISFPVNMDEVQEKMYSGEYDSEYDASQEDYALLIRLCKADASAQSEIAERTLPDGKKIVESTKAEKIGNMNSIGQSIIEAYKKVEDKVGYIKKVLDLAKGKHAESQRSDAAKELLNQYEEQTRENGQTLEDN